MINLFVLTTLLLAGMHASYGQSIDRSEEQTNSGLKELAFEVKYGKTPKNLSYKKVKENIDSTLVNNWLFNAQKSSKPEMLLNFLEPDFLEFTLSKKYGFHPEYKKLEEYQNFFRWVQRFEHQRFVLINIANNELIYYQDNLPVLRMNVIVGTAKNKTPTMATYADALVVYPYWTATRNIAFNEILPAVKKDIGYLARNSFVVLDKNYKIIDPTSIEWQSIDASNFQYTFRQGTGCDNSLGLLKINIENPLSVYMHDTPHTERSQSLFNKENRFFSHGCIRLQKPLELAQLLDPVTDIDENLMNECLINQTPKTISLKEKVPVFIMYFTDYIDENGDWKSVRDHYGLNKK